MTHRKPYLCLAALFLAMEILMAGRLISPSWAAEESAESSKDVPVEVVADSIQYDKASKKIIGQGNVLVTYKDSKLQADRAEVFTDTKKAYAEGHVTVFDGDSTLSGDKGEYDFANRTGTFPEGTGYQYPWYASGEKIEQVSRDEIRVRNGSATTCNLEDPHYDVISKNVTVYPNDKIILRNAFVRIRGRKVFWLPYLTIPLDERQSPIEIKTGYSDSYGYYINTAKGFSLTKNVKLKGHVDYRSLRGIAGGVDIGYAVPKFGRGKIVTYLIDDKRAPTPTDNPEVENPYANRQEKTRHRLSIRHRTDFEPRTNLIVNWHELSDEFLIQEFFQREDRKESRPRSQVVLTRTREDYGMFAEVVKRTNNFFSEIEKLPRLNFLWKSQPLFDTQFLYKHENQFTVFQKRLPRNAFKEDTFRFDTTHEIQRPFSIFDSRVKVTPFVNASQAFYTDHRYGSDTLARTLMGAGFEARTRYQRTFDHSSNFMNIEINQLRHIMEPIVRYNSVRMDNHSPEELFQMDEFDQLHKQDVVTLALDNRLQTKRSRNGTMQRVDLVSFSNFINFEFDGGRNGGSGLTDVGNQVSVRPYDWLLIESTTIFDLTITDFREHSFDLVIEPLDDDKIRFVLSQNYLRENPSISGSETSNIVATDFTYKLNELWKLGTYIRAELDDFKTEEWELRAIRDLHDFILTTGINVRKSDFRGGEGTNKEAFIELTMKAFPSVTMGVGSRSSITRPRIGQYYDGANAEEKNRPSQYYGAF